MSSRLKIFLILRVFDYRNIIFINNTFWKKPMFCSLNFSLELFDSFFETRKWVFEHKLIKKKITKTEIIRYPSIEKQLRISGKFLFSKTWSLRIMPQSYFIFFIHFFLFERGLFLMVACQKQQSDFENIWLIFEYGTYISNEFFSSCASIFYKFLWTLINWFL